MANYILQLQETVAQQDRAIMKAKEGFMDLAGYLSSSKFHTDTTVQVQDILTRLADINSNMNQELY